MAAAALSLLGDPLQAQQRTDPGIAENLRGETINYKPLLNRQATLNKETPLDQAGMIRDLSVVGEKPATPEARPTKLVAISIGEGRVPTQTELEMIQRDNRSKISLADVAREWKRQRELERTTAPVRKRWRLEQQ